MLNQRVQENYRNTEVLEMEDTLDVCVLSHVQLFVALCSVACQAPLSMVLSRQEYWSGLPEQRALTNISRKNEEAGSKQKQCSAVEVYGAESKVQCCKEKRCIGNLGP